jgi:RNA polymerase sigma-70 factor (ECF subfamily)
MSRGPGLLERIEGRLTRRRFERQTARFLPVLYRAARRLTDSEADAEDLVQDAYVKAFQAYDRVAFKSPGAFRGWLFRILVNTYRDLYRRRQNAPEIEVVDSDTGEPGVSFVERAADAAPSPIELLDRKRILEVIDASIAELAPEMRLVVTLFFVDELSYREIAEIVDCPVGTVTSRLARGRRHLQSRLDGYRLPRATQYGERMAL